MEPPRKTRLKRYGGAGRDRTGDLIVATDEVGQLISRPCFNLRAEYGPLRSNSNRLAWSCLRLHSITVHLLRPESCKNQ
jgi:hypothetical protein